MPEAVAPRKRSHRGDGWHVTMARSPGNWQNRDPSHAWHIVAHQSARSERTGERMAARNSGEDRRGKWKYRAGTVECEKQLPNGSYTYDFPGGTRVSGAKLYPILEWVVATPDLHPDRHLPVRELDCVLENGGPPTIR